MSKFGQALALAGAVAGGIVKGDQMRRRDDQEAEDRAWTQEQRGVQRAATQRENQNRVSLASAAAPTAVEEGAGGALRPETMDNRDVGAPGEAPMSLGNSFRAGGKTFADRAQADAAATDYNSEAATDKRIGLAMAKTGDVKGAKQYQASARQSEVSAIELADKRWGQQIRTAAGKGHEGLADFVSRSGADGIADVQVKAVPSPDGKQVTYHMVNPDGTTKPTNMSFSNDQDGVIRAAYMLDRSITPEKRYTHMVAEDKQTAAASAKERELTMRERELTEVKIPNAETKAKLAEVQASLAELRAQRAGAAGGGDGKVSREERLRYTTLFTDAGRRMQDVQKSINSLRKDPIFMSKASKPGSPEAVEMQSARDNLAALTEERQLYQGLLADGAGGKKPSLADAETKPGAKPAAQAVKVATKAERDKLPAGARYVGPDGQTYIKQ